MRRVKIDNLDADSIAHYYFPKTPVWDISMLVIAEKDLRAREISANSTLGPPIVVVVEKDLGARESQHAPHKAASNFIQVEMGDLELRGVHQWDSTTVRLKWDIEPVPTVRIHRCRPAYFEEVKLESIR